MPLRNPFARRPAGLGINTPDSSDNNTGNDRNHPGFERVDTVGSKASSALSVRSNKSQDNGEYKMSVVNDSGVYLPPSPTEEKGPWSRKYLSSRASTESSTGEIEAFSISRESFDSYRRSFDITAKSPINYQSEFPARQSLDSSRYPRYPRPSLHRKFEHQPPTAEEGFEDVGLDDQKHPKKRGFFSKLAESQEKDGSVPTMSRFLMPNRKRGYSGQGSELGSMEQSKPTPFGTASER